MTDFELPSQDEIEKLFNSPNIVEKGNFELALVLGGTVSAGAYTAGAIDFLAEALDCFEAAKHENKAPNHNVILRTVAGTSGGGVNAAIAARALNFNFPHVSAGALPSPADKNPNPFFEVWVNRLTLSRFLKTSDVRDSIPSLLNGEAIDDAADWLWQYTAQPLHEPRKWIANPLTVFLTVTNVCGLPYKIDFETGLNECFVNHAEFARFALHYSGTPDFEPRPDEFSLGFGDVRLPRAISWSDFSEYARATSAFPLGFPTRQLSRPLRHYAYRVVVVPSENGTAEIRPLRVDWKMMTGATGDTPPSDYQFSAVDGGVTDNEPIELARTSLSGMLGHNPRSPKEADRAVLLIDPFAGIAPMTASGVSGVLKTATATYNAFGQQTRYDTADLLLAVAPDVYSRYLLTPERDGRIGADAIASAGLGAFIGFACRDFMIHDYLLGRYNCQSYLRDVLRLDSENPLFINWSPEDKKRFADKDGQLPIIPLVGQANTDETLPAWPKGRLNPEIYREAIQTRIKAIFSIAEPDILSAIVTLDKLMARFVSWLGPLLSEKKATDFVIDQITKCLQETNLS